MAEGNADEAGWYVVSIHEGLARQICETLWTRATDSGLSHLLWDIRSSEEDPQVRSGLRQQTASKIPKSMLLVRLAMTEEMLHLVRRTPKVLGFAGGKPGQPLPLDSKQVMLILADDIARDRQAFERASGYQVAEQVRIVTGPFAGQTGAVERVDSDFATVRVKLSPWPGVMVEVRASKIERALST